MNLYLFGVLDEPSAGVGPNATEFLIGLKGRDPPGVVGKRRRVEKTFFGKIGNFLVKTWVGVA